MTILMCALLAIVVISPLLHLWLDHNYNKGLKNIINLIRDDFPDLYKKLGKPRPFKPDSHEKILLFIDTPSNTKLDYELDRKISFFKRIRIVRNAFKYLIKLLTFK